jgi:hypothetical protein
MIDRNRLRKRAKAFKKRHKKTFRILSEPSAMHDRKILFAGPKPTKKEAAAEILSLYLKAIHEGWDAVDPNPSYEHHHVNGEDHWFSGLTVERAASGDQISVMSM